MGRGDSNIQVLDDFPVAAADLIARRCQEVVTRRGVARIALAGGTTPMAVYEALSRSPIRETVDFSAIEFYQGDERPVGPEHPDSNWAMACRSLLDRVGVPAANRFRMVGEAADLELAAADYATLLSERLPLRGGRPVFDLILLGIGTDGHTASLFPDTAALEETERSVVANAVGRLRTNRLTLTFPAISAADAVWFLVAGESKAAILPRIVFGREDSLPAARIDPADGEIRWLIDRAAAANLGR